MKSTAKRSHQKTSKAGRKPQMFTLYGLAEEVEAKFAIWAKKRGIKV
jgi:hypothetical protein